jgi:hypothetical protein
VLRLGDRRNNRRQREAVDRVFANATGAASLQRLPDGSVVVYDEHREWRPPTTLRVRITSAGEVEPPDRLRFS